MGDTGDTKEAVEGLVGAAAGGQGTHAGRLVTKTTQLFRYYVDIRTSHYEKTYSVILQVSVVIVVKSLST